MTTWYKPSTKRADVISMELGNADIVCYKCDKRGHIMALCYAKVSADTNNPSKKGSHPKGGAKNQRAQHTDSASTTSGL